MFWKDCIHPEASTRCKQCKQTASVSQVKSIFSDQHHHHHHTSALAKTAEREENKNCTFICDLVNFVCAGRHSNADANGCPNSSLINHCNVSIYGHKVELNKITEGVAIVGD